MGILLLSGGGEFQKGNEAADRYALEQAGGLDAPVVGLVIADDPGGPGAAQNGLRWFRQLGATNVEFHLLKSRREAEKPELVAQLAAARLIFIAGGTPLFYLNTLQDSTAWAAIQQAHAGGAVLAGASAGAMILHEYMYDPGAGQVVKGLGLVPGAIFAPHFNSFGRKWVDKLQAALPQALILGVDEKVSMVGGGNDWQVYGRGWVTVYRQGQPAKYQGGQPFKLEV